MTSYLRHFVILFLFVSENLLAGVIHLPRVGGVGSHIGGEALRNGQRIEIFALKNAGPRALQSFEAQLGKQSWIIDNLGGPGAIKSGAWERNFKIRGIDPRVLRKQSFAGELVLEGYDSVPAIKTYWGIPGQPGAGTALQAVAMRSAIPHPGQSVMAVLAGNNYKGVVKAFREANILHSRGLVGRVDLGNVPIMRVKNFDTYLRFPDGVPELTLIRQAEGAAGKFRNELDFVSRDFKRFVETDSDDFGIFFREEVLNRHP